MSRPAPTVVGVLAVAALVACGSGKKGSPARPPATTSAHPTAAARPEPPVPIGRSVAVAGQTIAGQPPNVQLVVTVLKVRSIPDRAFDTVPPSGGTDGVLLKITNSGSQAFTDDLTSDVQLLTAGGQMSPGPALMAPDHGFCANNVNAPRINLPPGRTIIVCVPATPPERAKPTLVRFTPDGGLSMDYAQWQLR